MTDSYNPIDEELQSNTLEHFGMVDWYASMALIGLCLNNRITNHRMLAIEAFEIAQEMANISKNGLSREN